MACKNEIDQGPRNVRWTCMFQAHYVHPIVNPAFADERCKDRYIHVHGQQCTREKRSYCYEEA
jgi:hypothetical protein